MKDYCPVIIPPEPAVHYPTKEVRQVVKTVNGIDTVQFIMEEIDPLKVNEGLTVKDFSLDVLIKSNAVDLLKPNKSISPDSLKVASAAELFEQELNS